MVKRASRREFLRKGAGLAIAGGLASVWDADGRENRERSAGAMTTDRDGDALRLGIVGCAEGTHGKVWAGILASPDGRRFGMRPARVWDADAAAAESVAKETGAQAVKTSRQAGEGVDGVLIAELLPERYLELGRPFLEAGMRVFFNRPFAGSMADAQEILRLARAHGAKVYSASALFHTAAAEKARESLARLKPLRLFHLTGASDHIVFYLPHAIAALISVVGTGVETVRAVSLTPRPGDPLHADAPVVVYLQYRPDGAAGGARGVVEMIGPASKWYGFVLKLFGADAEGEEVHFEVSYDRLLEKMAEFFRTGIEPVPQAVLLEKTALYYAALQSAREGGKAVSVSSLLRG